ncbi:MAG: septum formation initiator family protein [Saprospiraceae bacterium]|nr:septum formation initiator family protein [Saprospiraceae bacterium]
MKTNIRIKMSPRAKKISKLLLNKYLFATVVFVFWIAFFDKNAFVTQWKLSRTIDKLQEEKSFLIEETEATRVLQKDIMTNKEKYAREKFFMKQPGEQVFIIK